VSAHLPSRLRREEGFTLIELLIAMMVLTIGILALVGAFSAGYASISRATTTSSASVLADSQMERYRALQYNAIQLNTTCGASCTEDATYTADSAYSSTAQVTGCTSTDASCLPTQTKTGPDGKSYRVDTFIAYSCASGTLATTPSLTCGSGQPLPVKLVTVVVRKAATGSTSWVREQSTFTGETGS
jgi:type IV pilus modification protein PilV